MDDSQRGSLLYFAYIRIPLLQFLGVYDNKLGSSIYLVLDKKAALSGGFRKVLVELTGIEPVTS